ncbi:MAG: Asp-tRNA(Asn)/Glu-tRNA(Gln) amidotransferase subunit GatC [Clostridia bacterium]|nr:Asp-tRNA(Asn)/Glu-tRNA(Gln) amidotransferase subunit GatC [Clostridia bacterium]
MSISVEEVKHIAKLARLNFSDEELVKFTEDMSKIVDMANEISSLDTENVKPTAHILENINVFRKDEALPSYDREEILKNAPTKESGCYSVPKVVE